MAIIKKIMSIINPLLKHKNVVTIGQQMAMANENEKNRIIKNDFIKSPMPEISYSNWPDERHLLNPIINSLDLALCDLCKVYENSGVERRLELRHSINMDEIYTLLTFSKRVAILGIRSQDRSLVWNGLIAISMIEYDRCDFRDILTNLSLLYHCALKASANPEQLFYDAAKLSEKKISGLILNFLERNEKDKDLRTSWGYEEVQTDNGIGFINWGFKQFNPSKDLKGLAIEISEYIRSDKYELGEVTAGTEIPPIWLLADKNIDVAKLAKCSKGFVSVSSHQRVGSDKNYASQLLLIYVGQMHSDSDAQFLLRCTQEITSTSYCKIGIATSDIFCLLITRSFVVGVEPAESSETIKRFEKPIESIIKKYT